MPGRSSSSKLKRAISNYNREVRRVSAHNKRVIDNYNRGVRAHNARVHRNRQRLKSELKKLSSSQMVSVRSVHFVTYQTSVQTLRQSFTRFEEADAESEWTTIDDELFDLAEGEVANSVATLNALLAEPSEQVADDPRLRETAIGSKLQEINPDLDARWRGALFSLNPANPDAARHFCTSAREVLVKILDQKAPDKKVLAALPNLPLTENGQVPRREKIRFMLGVYEGQNDELVDLVEDDINNVMDLFGDFNRATHGEAGKYDLFQLTAIKTRVEGAVQFLIAL